MQGIERRIALPQGDDVCLVAQDGEQIAEAPDAALVLELGRSAAFLPEPAKRAGVGKITFCGSACLNTPGGVFNLEQFIAVSAAEVLLQLVEPDHARASGTA